MFSYLDLEREERCLSLRRSKTHCETKETQKEREKAISGRLEAVSLAKSLEGEFRLKRKGSQEPLLPETVNQPSQQLGETQSAQSQPSLKLRLWSSMARSLCEFLPGERCCHMEVK